MTQFDVCGHILPSHLKIHIIVSAAFYCQLAYAIKHASVGVSQNLLSLSQVCSTSWARSSTSARTLTSTSSTSRRPVRRDRSRRLNASVARAAATTQNASKTSSRSVGDILRIGGCFVQLASLSSKKLRLRLLVFTARHTPELSPKFRSRTHQEFAQGQWVTLDGLWREIILKLVLGALQT